MVRVHGALAGCEARFDVTEQTIGGIPTDNTKRRELAGPTTVGWKDGMRRMVEARAAARNHELAWSD